LFPKITIHLDRNYYKSDTFTIATKGFSNKSIYIKSATLNGVPLEELHFDFAKLDAGSKLDLELSENAKQ
jgi:putative alpha-1,2-mannosidase